MTAQDVIELGDELFWEPRRLVFPGPWSGHIPFAFWIVKVLRPGMVVELGTHSGNSYSALCQALQDFDVPGRAYAVDTWRGDEHSGNYDEAVYLDLHRFNQLHYSAISTLLRMTFDEARSYFGPNSIDLLHIDGMHTYDAVKADFLQWKDTLTGRGVVLFHDINVRERDFGVWRLWEELSAAHPSFEFHHSNGLGVLGYGSDLPAPLRALFNSAPDQAAEIRRTFAQAGKLFQARSDFIASTLESERRQHGIEELNRAVESAHQALSHERGTIGALKHEVGLLKAERASLKAFGADKERDIERLQMQNDQETGRLQSDIERLRSNIRLSDQEIERLNEAGERSYAEAERRTADQVAALHHLYRNSTSWRITRPLRVVVRLMHALARPEGRAQLVQIAKQGRQIVNRRAAQVARRVRQKTEPSPENMKQKHRTLLKGRLQDFTEKNKRLALPVSDAPDVSIIIIAFNQPELILDCLDSIASCLSNSSLGIETIIWDNGSDTETEKLLQSVSGIKYIKFNENLHFLRGVNRSVDHASGRHLLLLNSDARVTPNSLERAVELLDADGTIGAVGGRLILPNGKLQEAGSIVWRDGTCVAYAYGAEPERADVMFRRDVDYCSGAFIVTPRQLFLDMNRFDERYVPAYYEETDYCVRLWERGHRVVYDPAIVTHHFEFGSSATSQDALDLQQRNYRIFQKVHADWLGGKHAPSDDAKLVAREASGKRGPRVLFIEDRVPHATLGSGYPRANDMVRELLALGAQVTLFPMFDHSESWPAIWESLSPEVEVMLGSDAGNLEAFLGERRDFYDLVLVSRPHNMRKVVKILEKKPDALGRARIVYDAEAIFARRSALARQFGQNAGLLRDQTQELREEIGLTRKADAIVAVSEQEQAIFQQETDKPVHALGHMLVPDVTDTGFEDRTDILFVGPAYDDNTPNVDSLRWFAQSVLPEIRQALGPQIRLKVIGTVTAPSIRALAKTDLELLGRVPDLKPFMEKARLVVVPTRFAAGVPHKAHHTASFGVPMVATELIREQLGWTNGTDILSAPDADPAAFAAQCVALYGDADLWRKVRDNALVRVRRECSPDGFRSTVASLLELGKEGKASSHRDASSGSETAQDRSLAIPLSFVEPSSEPGTRSAAVMHVFYEEMAPSIRAYVSNVPGALDLFVSTDTQDKADRIGEAFYGWHKGSLDIRVFPNRGRDIAPKIVGFREVYDRYERVLHLHSKASTHDGRLNDWRSFLMDHLVGSEETVRSIFEIFDADPRVGIVAPQHLEYVRPWINWGVNFENGRKLAERMGIRIAADDPLDFASGSMFWARSAALRPLLDLDLSFDEFEEERGQKDATLAHAVERVYFLCCHAAGFKPVKVSLPARFSDKSHIGTVQNRAELSAWLNGKDSF